MRGERGEEGMIGAWWLAARKGGIAMCGSIGGSSRVMVGYVGSLTRGKDEKQVSLDHFAN